MGSTMDKVKGATNEAVGKAKQGIGEATDNDRLKGEGKVQETKGEAQQVVGKAKDALKDSIDKA
ncbi:CsbD family protein [Pseudomonas mangiferae]|uniref:CsbD family protein n=1 Tax=Pseudomonas mangiferae TaxID=2593654 RepID=A0A553GUR4_9PSED|nr:CsbD family protein [Pseudomonas mangiferae]TRX73231.1 CsbD family protein [Pseudomonas mangiferae]